MLELDPEPELAAGRRARRRRRCPPRRRHPWPGTSGGRCDQSWSPFAVAPAWPRACSIGRASCFVLGVSPVLPASMSPAGIVRVRWCSGQTIALVDRARGPNTHRPGCRRWGARSGRSSPPVRSKRGLGDRGLPALGRGPLPGHRPGLRLRHRAVRRVGGPRGPSGPADVDRITLRRYLAFLATRRYSKATISRTAASLRSYFGWCARRDARGSRPVGAPVGAVARLTPAPGPRPRRDRPAPGLAATARPRRRRSGRRNSRGARSEGRAGRRRARAPVRQRACGWRSCAGSTSTISTWTRAW